MAEEEIQKAPALPEISFADMLMEADEELSELDKIFEQMMDPRNIMHNTELTRNEITAFTSLGPLARRYNLTCLKETLLEGLVARVSRNRKGRREWVKIITRQMEREEQKEGRFGNLFDRRGGHR